jgi:hypothetical protein
LLVFAPLVGTEWEAPLGATELVDRQRFAWMLGGRFLRSTHEVRDARGAVVYAGETVYAWDVEEEALVWWYWNTTGGYVRGTALGEEGRVRAEGENRGGPGQVERVRTVLEIGEGGWTSSSSSWTKGSWVEEGRSVFRPVE